jgi:Choline/Carnitine o-acyltransferase
MGPHLLDMSQYHKVLGTCRIPGLKKDKLRLPDNANPAKHIVVMHNNHVRFKRKYQKLFLMKFCNF